MKKVFKVLGFLFYYISPFIIVYLNHAVLEDGGFNVDLTGLLIVLIAVFGLYKWLEHKKNIKEIQDKSKMFIIMWNGFKRIGVSVLLYWLLVTIDDNIAKLVLTMQLLTLTFIIGFLFTVLGERK
jgi:small-conductance mechanosensitive channel